ncbi:MAG TPA: EamA family transporter, partial [Reyranellaceae bacterium]|nr:EamA family transporter [Reyranellaceae bacterium]
MTPLHTAAALLIAAMWGFNFTAIRFGLDEMAPFAFATWRFVLCALPVLFVPRPAISWGALAGIGVFMLPGVFLILFFTMMAGLPPGLT